MHIAPTFSTATPFQRVQMIEEALEKVLNRGPEMSVETYAPGEPLHLYVNSNGWDALSRTSHSLYDMARELEVLLS